MNWEEVYNEINFNLYVKLYAKNTSINKEYYYRIAFFGEEVRTNKKRRWRQINEISLLSEIS